MTKKTIRKEEIRPIERYFQEINEWTQNPVHQWLQVIFLPLAFFGFMTMIWMIPFPEIEFLKKHGYHIFLNWGSFFIAGVIYFYLKLAPILSYFMLLLIGAMSYFIVQLEYVQADGGPAVWLVGLLIFVFSVLMLFWGSQKETPKLNFKQFFKIMIIGPIWVLWNQVLRRFNIKF